jgi:hypothetical protein
MVTGVNYGQAPGEGKEKKKRTARDTNIKIMTCGPTGFIKTTLQVKFHDMSWVVYMLKETKKEYIA